MAEAYKRRRFEGVKRMFAERERYISIIQPEAEAIEEVRRQTEEKTKQLRENFDSLYSENMTLKRALTNLENTVEKQQKAMKWMLSEIRMFQRATLERMGDSPEEVEKNNETNRIQAGRVPFLVSTLIHANQFYK